MCKTAVTVTEEDIVQHGEKTAADASGEGKLRQTKPGDMLRATKLVKVEEVVEQMHPPTSDDIPVADPITAEFDLEPEEEEEEEKKAEPKKVAFGIVKRTRAGARRENRNGLGLTVGAPGVHVSRGGGTSKHDNVYGDVSSKATAIGRISIKKVRAIDPDRLAVLNGDDLPAVAEEPKKLKKLDLSRLRRAMKRLDAKSPEELKAEEPPVDVSEDLDLDVSEDLDLDLDVSEGLDLDQLVSEAAEQMEAEEIEEESFDAPLGGEDSGATVQVTPEELMYAMALAKPPTGDLGDATPLPAPDEEEEQEELGEEVDAEEAESSDPIDAEPTGSTLDVQDSEAYELGDAEVPARAERPKEQGHPGLLIGVVLLAFVALVAAFVL